MHFFLNIPSDIKSALKYSEFFYTILTISRKKMSLLEGIF